jgi:hypothetical protein
VDAFLARVADALLDQVEALLRGGPAVGVELNGRPLTE